MTAHPIKTRLLVLVTGLLISNIVFSAAPATTTSPSYSTVTQGLSAATIDGTSKAALIGAGVGPLTNAAASI